LVKGHFGTVGEPGVELVGIRQDFLRTGEEMLRELKGR
jgi:hypothetical protein